MAQEVPVPERTWQEFTECFLHIGVFLLSGPALILLHKYVLDVLVFEFPIFIVATGSIARWILVMVLVHTGAVKLGKHENMSFMQWTREMLPVGVLESISLATGTAAYLRLSLSFLQILKAFQPVVLNFLLVTFELERLSWKLFGCIVVACVGSILAAIGEVHWDNWGFILMLISELAEVGDGGKGSGRRGGTR